MRTCRFCAEEIPEETTLCPHCGSALGAGPVTTSGDVSTNIFQQTWFIVLMLIAVTPWGIVLMWLQKRREGFFGLGSSLMRLFITMGLGAAWLKVIFKLLG